MDLFFLVTKTLYRGAASVLVFRYTKTYTNRLRFPPNTLTRKRPPVFYVHKRLPQYSNNQPLALDPGKPLFSYIRSLGFSNPDPSDTQGSFFSFTHSHLHIHKDSHRVLLHDGVHKGLIVLPKTQKLGYDGIRFGPASYRHRTSAEDRQNKNGRKANKKQ